MDGLGILVIFGIILLIAILRQVLSYFDWGSWEGRVCPDPNAQIIDVSREQVKYAKNDVRYKTTVLFSDGYRFVTTKTKRKQGFMSYRIFVDAELDAKIRQKAIRRHDKAAQRKLK